MTVDIFDTLAGAVTGAVDGATGFLQDNLLVVLAIPVAFVAYKLVRRLISKVG